MKKLFLNPILFNLVCSSPSYKLAHIVTYSMSIGDKVVVFNKLDRSLARPSLGVERYVSAIEDSEVCDEDFIIATITLSSVPVPSSHPKFGHTLSPYSSNINR